MYSFVCELFELFPNISLRTSSFWQHGTQSTREALPDTLVEIRAQSVHSGVRGKPSKIIFSGSRYDDFPGFSDEALVFSYIRTGTIYFASEHSTDNIRYNSSSSSSGQPRCIAAASYFHPSLRSITPQQHTTSLSDAVRDRVIVQHVGAVAHNSATPATDNNTISAESVLAPI